MRRAYTQVFDSAQTDNPREVNKKAGVTLSEPALSEVEVKCVRWAHTLFRQAQHDTALRQKEGSLLHQLFHYINSLTHNMTFVKAGCEAR